MTISHPCVLPKESIPRSKATAYVNHKLTPHGLHNSSACLDPPAQMHLAHSSALLDVALVHTFAERSSQRKAIEISHGQNVKSKTPRRLSLPSHMTTCTNIRYHGYIPAFATHASPPCPVMLNKRPLTHGIAKNELTHRPNTRPNYR